MVSLVREVARLELELTGEKFELAKLVASGGGVGGEVGGVEPVAAPAAGVGMVPKAAPIMKRGAGALPGKRAAGAPSRKWAAGAPSRKRGRRGTGG